MPQVWPQADTFDHGSPAYGAQVIGYLGLRPDTGSALASARLSDGYRGGASFAQGSPTGNSAAVVRRQVFAADVKVTAVIRLHAVSGAISATHFGLAGCVARIQGGSIAGDGTASVRLEAVSGYGFVVSKLTSTTLRFRLLRWNSGTETVLATADLSAADVGHFIQDVTLSLVVTQSDSDVLLSGFVTQIALSPGAANVLHQQGGTGAQVMTGSKISAGPAPPLSAGTPAMAPPGVATLYGASKSTGPVEIVSFTDTGGSVVSGSGRCGFLMDTDRDHGGGITSVAICSAFEVSTLSGSAYSVTWRDEWSRAAPQLAQAVTDAHGTAGRNLGCDYTTDQASSETDHPLLRTTADESAGVASQTDLGVALELEGDKAQWITLADPSASFPAPAPASTTQVSIALWTDLDDDRDGNQFYDAYHIDAAGSIDDGFMFGLEDRGSGNARVRVELGGLAVPSAYTSDDFAIAPYLNQTWAWVMTYKANANTGTGEGRLRVYVGRFGAATLIEEWTVPASVRPTWSLVDRHNIGYHVFGVLFPDDFYLDGTIDEVSVYYRELSASEAGVVCDQFASHEQMVALGAVHGLDFETYNDNDPAAREYAPWLPAGVDSSDWWLEVGPSGFPLIADPGLVPASQQPLVSWHQRRASDPVTQSRAISVRPGDENTLAGIVLRGSPGSSSAVYDGYRLDVAPGSPAPVNLYRVVGGQATLLARQDTSGSPLSLSTGSYTAIELNVAQQSSASPAGAVKLWARIGGAAVSWSVLAADAGLDGSGNVIDFGDDRITSGLAVGFHTLVDTAAVRLDDWQDGAGTPTAIAYPNLPFGLEGDDPVGDLASVCTVEYGFELDAQAPRRTVDFDAPYQERLALGTYDPRTFRCRATMTQAQRVAFEAFWDAHRGPEVGFTWNPSGILPFAQAGTFHFKAESMAWQPLRQKAWRVEFTLEERRATPTT